MTLFRKTYPTIGNFSCLKGQEYLLKYIKEEKEKLFKELVASADVTRLKYNRDVLVTIYKYNAEDNSVKQVTDLYTLKSSSSFAINSNVCSTYIDELDLYVDNIFLICY